MRALLRLAVTARGAWHTALLSSSTAHNKHVQESFGPGEYVCLGNGTFTVHSPSPLHALSHVHACLMSPNPVCPVPNPCQELKTTKNSSYICSVRKMPACHQYSLFLFEELHVCLKHAQVHSAVASAVPPRHTPQCHVLSPVSCPSHPMQWHKTAGSRSSELRQQGAMGRCEKSSMGEKGRCGNWWQEGIVQRHRSHTGSTQHQTVQPACPKCLCNTGTNERVRRKMSLVGQPAPGLQKTYSEGWENAKRRYIMRCMFCSRRRAQVWEKVR